MHVVALEHIHITRVSRDCRSAHPISLRHDLFSTSMPSHHPRNQPTVLKRDHAQRRVGRLLFVLGPAVLGSNEMPFVPPLDQISQRNWQ